MKSSAGRIKRQCPSCNLINKARYYSYDQNNVTMIDSLGAILGYGNESGLCRAPDYAE